MDLDNRLYYMLDRAYDSGAILPPADHLGKRQRATGWIDTRYYNRRKRASVRAKHIFVQERRSNRL